MESYAKLREGDLDGALGGVLQAIRLSLEAGELLEPGKPSIKSCGFSPSCALFPAPPRSI